MLQFQAGEQTELGKAPESLGRYTEDEQAAREHKGFTMTVCTFDRGSDDDKAEKILEEAGEVRGALQYEGREAEQTLYEIVDKVTACLSLVQALDCTAEEFQKLLDMIDGSNTRRGR